MSEVTTPSGTALALVKPLTVMQGAPDAVLLLRYPLDQALAGYHRLQLAILMAGLLGLLLTIAATWRTPWPTSAGAATPALWPRTA